ALLSLVAAAGSHLSMRQPQLSLFGYTTVLIAGLAFLVIAVAIWSGGDGDAEGAFCLLIAAFACGHTSLLLTSSDQRDSDGVPAVRYGTIAALWLLAVLGIAEILENGHQVDAQLMGVVAVLYALGAVLLPLLRRMAPPPQAQAQVQEEPAKQGELQTDHLCFVWPGNIDSAVIHLTNRGVQVVEGPVPRRGAQGDGTSVYYRDPDGGLVELISYGPGS
ncbi:MAG TPA: AmiS/UreI family transporter, partial [Solirubrobacterales bacterium]|nr:AmiS/UreI family transporter [Solirubrobacterales bacterium]